MSTDHSMTAEEAAAERLTPHHPDPEIAAEVATEGAGARAWDAAHGIPDGWHRGQALDKLGGPCFIAGPLGIRPGNQAAREAMATWSAGPEIAFMAVCASPLAKLLKDLEHPQPPPKMAPLADAAVAGAGAFFRALLGPDASASASAEAQLLVVREALHGLRQELLDTIAREGAKTVHDDSERATFLAESLLFWWLGGEPGVSPEAHRERIAQEIDWRRGARAEAPPLPGWVSLREFQERAASIEQRSALADFLFPSGAPRGPVRAVDQALRERDAAVAALKAEREVHAAEARLVKVEAERGSDERDVDEVVAARIGLEDARRSLMQTELAALASAILGGALVAKRSAPVGTDTGIEHTIDFSAEELDAAAAGTLREIRRSLAPQPPSPAETKAAYQTWSFGPAVSREIGAYSLNHYDRLPKEPGTFDVGGSVGWVRDRCGVSRWTCPHGLPGDALRGQDGEARRVLDIQIEHREGAGWEWVLTLAEGT